VDDEVIPALLARLRAGESLPAAKVPWLAAQGFTALTGLVLDEIALDRVTAHLDIDDRHHQPFGIVHGGVWCTVVESIASIGASLHTLGDGRVVVGVANATDFVRPVRDGRVQATATPVHVGRTQQLWLVEIRRGDDAKLVARGQVRLQHIDPAS
jgi:1,4-dihydroxy-2-naphthoyl-CoA hydrolase